MTDSHYDALICYDRRDSKWVADDLLPQLEGFAYAIDFNDFIPGRRLISELFRLHSVSRCTLIVLSEHWTSSPQAMFCVQMAQYHSAEELQDRVVALRLKRCLVPEALSNATIIDFDQPNSRGPLELHKFLFRNAPPLGTLAISPKLALAKGDAPGGDAGQCYIANITIGNPRPHAIIYDTIILGFDTTGQLGSGRNVARSINVGSIEDHYHLVHTYYHEDFFLARKRVQALYEDGSWDAHVLPGFSAVTMRNIPFLYAPVSITGQAVTTLSLSLAIGDTEVTAKCSSPLPPISLAPDVSQAVRQEITLLGPQYLPKPSAATDPAVVGKATATASSSYPDSVLIRITPRFVTKHEIGREIFHSCADWCFLFYSSQGGRTFSLHALDPTWIDEEFVENGNNDAGTCLNVALLGRCRLDCRDAYLIARLAGMIEEPDSLDFDLECQIVDGYPQPIWRLPFSSGGRLVSVRADTGELLVLIDGRWQAP